MAKMNAQQRRYAVAKALAETLEAESARIEWEYIAQHGIKNPDGSVPKKIWMIEDEGVFDRANEATAGEIDALGLYEAREALKKTENELIKFGLSLAPARERQILSDRCFGQNGHYVHIDVREKVIDLAFGLDVSTVRRVAK